jgi:hypothetical protein
MSLMPNQIGTGALRWRALGAATALLLAVVGVGAPPAQARADGAGQDFAPVGTPLSASALAPASITARDATDASPTHYYVWDQVTARYTGPRDAHGVVTTDVRYGRPPAYNTVAVAEWALHFYENWLHTGRRAEYDDFLVQARWLRTAMDSQGRFPYRYRHIGRGISPPWYSAMAQGLAISVFVRAHSATGQDSYIVAAQKAVRPFANDVRHGGVVTAGGAWLEEYPDARHVLNGSIFAAFGLWDLMRVTGRVDPAAGSTPTLAETTFATFTANLGRSLYRYESRGAILYEIGGGFSRIPYYDLHLRQLRALAQVTGDARFSDTATRWATRFRAYPGPVIELSRPPGRAAGYRTVTGKVRFLYSTYYGKAPRAVIRRLNKDGTTTRMGSALVRYGAAGDIGWFSWAAPASRRTTTYRVTIDAQPHTGDSRFDYRQRSTATITVPGTLR